MFKTAGDTVTTHSVFRLANEERRKEHFPSGLAINFVINRTPIKLTLCDIKVIRFAGKKKNHQPKVTAARQWPSFHLTSGQGWRALADGLPGTPVILN